MELVLFCHPSFFPSQSMPRFAQMLKSAYEARGHRVAVWSPRAGLFKFVPRGRFSKWAGYFDQYVLFPIFVRKQMRRTPADTLFVFCDQALGPWVPLAADRPHVIHVHDLLALRSALGDIPENPTSVTGRMYQRYIRRGFRRGRHFISVSNKSREDLHRFGLVDASTSEVVYNGMSYPFAQRPKSEALELLRAAGFPFPPNGMILHVGGGQWYKNRRGVLAIYGRYAARAARPPQLWIVGSTQGAAARPTAANIGGEGRVLFLGNVDSPVLQALYSVANAFLFPSLEEGFGWPLIEAQACGCPVITTARAPMTEVAGDAACYLPRLQSPQDLESWSQTGASLLERLLAEDSEEKALRRTRGLEWAARFGADRAIEEYLAIYARVLDAAVGAAGASNGRNRGEGP
jgi:glycosyltransferase involved in cell wall biosynthesis